MTLKESMMNARFLRDEAARFRGMVDDTDHEATKVRLLAMAVDYEARAGIANEVVESNSDAMISEGSEPDLDGESKTLNDPDVAEPINVRPGRKIGTGSKETVLVRRRPVGRPRRE